MGNVLVGEFKYTRSTNVTLEVDKMGFSPPPTLLQVIFVYKHRKCFYPPLIKLVQHRYNPSMCHDHIGR